MKQYSKFKSIMRNNKKMIVFLVGLLVVGIVAGSFFVAFLKRSDQALLMEYIETFVSNLKNGNLNQHGAFLSTLVASLTMVLMVWLLGISVVGIPVILFTFFMKAFVLGVSITAILMKYQLKGIVFSFLYIAPHHILNLFCWVILLLYSLTVSIKIIRAMLKREAFDFKKILTQYSRILLFVLIGTVVTTLMEIYLTPVVLKTWIPFL